MKHLADPIRTIFDHDKSLSGLEAKALVSMNADQIRDALEARFLERWSYCGIDLKDPKNVYTVAMHAGRSVPFPQVCGDCLGALDEVRRKEGKPTLREEREEGKK